MGQRQNPQGAERLNFNHLLYFWKVARLRSVARAAESLGVSQPTVSAQLRALATTLDDPLLTRSGRVLIMTDLGKVVFRYADEIFELGDQLMRFIRDHADGPARPFHVGVLDALPKVVVHRLLGPLLRRCVGTRLSCREADIPRLVDGLTTHDLDVILSDHPIQGDERTPVFSHELLKTGCVVMATPELAASVRVGFPQSLEEAPFLLPSRNSQLRKRIDGWLSERGIRVCFVAEFDDSALLKQFARAGHGLFVAPEIVRSEVELSHGVVAVGPMTGLEQTYFALTTSRRIEHPLVKALLKSASD